MSELIQKIKEANDLYHLNPADGKMVFDAEKAMGGFFASDYKEYLLYFGVASFNGKELTGICDSERLNVIGTTERTRKKYPSFPQDAYVIEETLCDGIVIAQKTDGSVWAWGPNDWGTLIAKDLFDYLFMNC